MTDEEAKNKGGRPALPDELKRRHDGRVRFNDAEFDAIKAAAVADGVKQHSVWTRAMAVAAAKVDPETRRRFLAAAARAERRRHRTPPES